MHAHLWTMCVSTLLLCTDTRRRGCGRYPALQRLSPIKKTFPHRKQIINKTLLYQAL